MRLHRGRLLWRGTFFLSCSVALALTLFGASFSRFLVQQSLKGFRIYGSFALRALESGYSQSMIHQDRKYVRQLFAQLSQQQDVRTVAVFDRSGKPVAGTGDMERMGLELAALPGHSPEGTISPSAVDGRERTLIFVRRLYNEQPCLGCHPGTRGLLGTIGLELSLKNFDRFIATTRSIILLASGVLLLLLVAVNLAFFRRYVTTPLGELTFKVNEVERGAGDVVFRDDQRDEIADLERSFGTMVRKLQELHRTDVEREKKMVLMTQQLKHQMELSMMNRQLEQRVRELAQAGEKNLRLSGKLEEKNLHLSNVVKRISALKRLGVALSSELEMERLIRLVVNVAMKGLRAECGFLMLKDDEGSALRIAHGMGLGEEYDRAMPVEVGDSISGMVAETGKPLLLADMREQSRFRRQSRYGFTRRSVICAPLKVKERVLGTIELTNKKGEETFTGDDLEMLTSIGAQAAIAIENARLYLKIQKSYLDTVRALIQAVEEKDPYTRGHSERVTIFSLKIAENMGLDQKNRALLEYAGYLHDIGKIGIDINILQKKGKLAAEEFNLVRNHPLIGERIITPIEFLKDVKEPVSQHHERYDGFGYPLGLHGEQTCLAARILAVADAYDAMITDRPYRKAFSKEMAVAELRRCSGTQFDPGIVSVFLEVLGKDQEILELQRTLYSVGT